MERNVSEQDYELLSAYIDGMLTAEERSILERRLSEENNLQRELTALRQTIALVKQLPALKAPRDFTLPMPVAATKTNSSPRWLIFPATTAFSALSSAAATLLVVLGIVTLLNSNAALPFPSSVIMSQPTDALTTTTVEEQQTEALQANQTQVAFAPETPPAFASPSPDLRSEESFLDDTIGGAAGDGMGGGAADTSIATDDNVVTQMQEEAAESAPSDVPEAENYAIDGADQDSAAQLAPPAAANTQSEARFDDTPAAEVDDTLAFAAPQGTPTPAPSDIAAPTQVTPTPTLPPPAPLATPFSAPVGQSSRSTGSNTSLPLGGGLVITGVALYGIAYMTNRVRRRTKG